jgi:hypothetical protein
MKKNQTRISIALPIFALFLSGCLFLTQACTSRGTRLQVLNPRGAISLPPVSPPSPRIADLAGKKIGLYWNEKAGGIHFWNGIERQLQEKLPDTVVLRYRGGFDLGDSMAEKIAAQTDAFLYGVGD